MEPSTLLDAAALGISPSRLLKHPRRVNTLLLRTPQVSSGSQSTALRNSSETDHTGERTQLHPRSKSAPAASVSGLGNLRDLPPAVPATRTARTAA
jgi:hypothetical protein